MSQHDYNLANQSGALFRADLNNALGAIQSNNASTVAPSATVAFMSYADSSASVMKIRNGADSLFVDVFKINTSTVTPYANGVLLSSPVQSANNNTFAVAQRAAQASVTYASTVTLSFNDANDFNISALTGNLTLANPSSIASAVGQGGSIWVTQDGTGSRTVSFGSMFKFPDATAPTASTASSTKDRIDYKVQNASTIDAVMTLNVG